MIILEDKKTHEKFKLIDVYLESRPYHEGYVTVIPYPNDYDLDPYVERSDKFKAIQIAQLNGDFCKEHDIDQLILLRAGIKRSICETIQNR